MNDTVAERIGSLRRQVDAARDEFELAVAFHRVGRPCALDEGLHARVGQSYAANAFNVVRTALQREMLMALMRIFDWTDGAVSLKKIRNILQDRRVIKELAIASAQIYAARDDALQGLVPWLSQEAEKATQARADDAIALIDSFDLDEQKKVLRDSLVSLRNKVFAHRQIAQDDVPEHAGSILQIDQLMSDMAKLISLLCGIAYATAYDLEQTGQVYDLYASMFWAPVKGERTEGHPSFQPPTISAK